MKTQEKKFNGFKISGFLGIFIVAVVIALNIWIISFENIIGIVLGILGNLIFIASLAGLVMIEPNDARVMVFFGKYRGTVTDNGFFWVNPFYQKRRITLRARNLDIPPVKVNDKVGNPIMIGSVIVWKIKDTYKAMFNIDSSLVRGSGVNVTSVMASQLSERMLNYENFVKIQSDAALRKIAGLYAYDNNESEGDAITLRSDNGEISQRLEEELNQRLELAGIEIVEARINYLAYASEIASVMLRRQQADAIISAREKIVEGAVSMVHMALDKLAKEEIVELDEDKKAAMVSNLLVVLCADDTAQPVINTGTLYQ